MSEHLFGLGAGHLPQKANTIAERHGARLCNYTDPGCKCGRGCLRDCPASRRHWFAGPNRGEPFDGTMANGVMCDLRAAGIVA
jgi:hypothetical protein